MRPILLHITLTLSMLLSAVALCGCTGGDSGADDGPPSPAKPGIDMVELPDGAPATLYAPAEGGTVTVRFNATRDWIINIPASLETGNGHVSQERGTPGDITLVFTAFPNTTPDERTTNLLVTAGKATLTIPVVQPSLHVELPEEEEVRQYLIRLYNETDGPNWRFKERWCSDLPINQWGSSVKYAGGKLELWLTENYLKGDFDMSGCKALTYVKLTKNELTSLNVSDCPLLKEISVTSNRLTEINISGCHSLTDLYAGYNPLTHVDLSGHHALRNVWFPACRLTSLDLTDCTVLEELSVSENSLVDLKLPAARNRITTIWCFSNALRALDLTGCTALTLLNCGDNELASLNIYGCSRLDRLYCYENNLAEIDVSSQRAVLAQFYCHSNRLTGLNLRGFKKLHQLNCGNNLLTRLDLTGCADMRWILCPCNDISELLIDPAVNMLNILDITSNRLTSVDFAPFGTSTAFCELYCRDNPISAEIPGRVATMDVFDHDARYEYLPGGGYTDHITGWWYPGEPQSGRHEPPAD